MSTEENTPALYSQQRRRFGTRESFVVWFTGLSGVGKSTIAQGLKGRLADWGCSAYVLDGDVLREGLCQDLGFSEPDRHENNRRAGHVARILVDAGVIVLASFISPYEMDRERIRSLFAPGHFIEVHVDCPLDILIKRDPKELYQKARAGLIREFTGITAPYDTPEHPDLRIETDQMTIQESVDAVWNFLLGVKLLPEPQEQASLCGRERAE